MAAAWNKKKNEWNMGEHNPTEEQVEARLWCIKNAIHISPLAKEPGKWWIDITINGKTNRSPYAYIAGDIWKKVYEYYEYYYEKYFRNSK